MKRREFITVLGSAAAWPLAARAQQGERVRRIGVLTAYSESDPEAQARVGAFREGLQKLGWTEGRNIRIDARWATSDAALMERFAQELVALQPELILSSSRPTTAALLHQTRTIPIIFAIVADPVGSNRRAFISGLGGAAAAWPLAARAQQTGGMRRIGVLTAYSESDPEAQARVGAFREGLQKLGWTEGRNIRIDARWATSDAALMQ